MFGFLKRLITSKTRSSKVIRNKNGSTSTFTKTKSNGKTKWTKTGGSKWKGSKPKGPSLRRKKTLTFILFYAINIIADVVDGSRIDILDEGAIPSASTRNTSKWLLSVKGNTL